MGIPAIGAFDEFSKAPFAMEVTDAVGFGGVVVIRESFNAVPNILELTQSLVVTCFIAFQYQILYLEPFLLNALFFDGSNEFGVVFGGNGNV